MWGLLMAVFGVFAIIVFVSMKLFGPDSRQLFVGYLSVASLISMFASPLFIIVSSYENFAILTFDFEILYLVLLITCLQWHSCVRIWWFEQGVLNTCRFIYHCRPFWWAFPSSHMECSSMILSSMWVTSPMIQSLSTELLDMGKCILKN